MKLPYRGEWVSSLPAGVCFSGGYITVLQFQVQEILQSLEGQAVTLSRKWVVREMGYRVADVTLSAQPTSQPDELTRTTPLSLAILIIGILV